ncbi:hypothetical protein BDV25DRAFT_150731 [Aspergillus avenaceus]|uniref:Uncharacterized protein n=1 Tax=Aspergillus avenaceus TaxID=36643 RepID=A0A5N6U1W1_ASPAV|nr:hypothetical protein BDV25DRAFT_150731 [Aspergillus avenaceus]
MASIVHRPLNRLRRNDSYKPLHERWGDVSISAPTDGSWNQYNNHTHQQQLHTNHSAEYCSREIHDRNKDSSTPPPKHNSFSISTLNPRRLSMRLAPRPKQPESRERGREQRHEFAYRPVHQDYPSEVAETTASRTQDSPRFRYIPAGARYAEELDSPRSHRFSTSSQASVQSRYADFDERSRRYRRDTLVDDDEGEEGEARFVEPYDRSVQSSRSGYRSSSDYSQRSRLSRNEASSSEKKRLRAARRLTMTMVPDSDEMYG